MQGQRRRANNITQIHRSDVTPIADPIVINGLVMEYPNGFVGVQFFSDAAGTVSAVPTAGSLTAQIKTINTGLFEDFNGNVIDASHPRTLNWTANATDFQITPTGIDVATHYKVIVTINENAPVKSDDDQLALLQSWNESEANAVTIITSLHRKIHNGLVFDSSGFVSAIADGANFDILFRVPAGETGHLFGLEYTLQDGGGRFYFYEGTTTSDDGTAVNIRNHNRLIGIDAQTVIVTRDPVVTDVGTELHTRYIPQDTSGGGSQKSTGISIFNRDEEWVMGHPTIETTYMWRYTNNSGGSVDMSFHFNGYQ